MGLCIGVTALMLTTSIINGFQEVISNKLSSIEGYGRVKHLLGKSIDLKDELLESFIKDKTYQIKPFIRDVCMIRKGKRLEGVLIEGVSEYPKLLYNMESVYAENGKIILGEMLANSLGVKIGDKIFLQNFSSERTSSLGSKIISFKVSNIFNTGLQEYDKSIAYIEISEAQNFFGFANNKVSGLIVDNGSPFMADFDYPFYFETWKDRHKLLFEWITIQRWPAYIMFGLITLVGLVNLFAAIAMIIIEKNGQIAILISEGMQKKEVRNIFMLQGGIIGLLGALIGGLLSILLIKIQKEYGLLNIPSDIYFMDQIPFSFNFENFAIIMILVFICSIIASWWPTRSLNHLKSSEILRYE
ncbi:MAG: hypothetical protein CMG55_02495 [Candidatus Marinimicrobia bacterium]|nr:hypothetical protein [Candidatus Neomarinimicrobiota bacterium]|tara:strand:+ start:731 stop:1804 length:1074 start_codon:yes stop_codon:yes gene_type:complete